MKAIIDGKLYDTETATELARWRSKYLPQSASLTHGDKEWREYSIVLYRTAKGAHFKHVLPDEPAGYFDRQRLTPIRDDQLVYEVLWYGGLNDALRLFPDRIEVA